MRHAYLRALEASGSVGGDTGWQPVTLTVRLRDGGELVAAAAAYLKMHSYGEYVFDWAWADAYRRYGVPYYPKLLVAVPFTPVPGSRLLARDAPARALLLRALGRARARDGLLVGAPAVRRRGRLRRRARRRLDDAPGRAVPLAQPARRRAGRRDAGDAHRAALRRLRRLPGQPAARQAQEDRAGAPPRRRGRRHVRDAGRRADSTQADWDFFHACYRNTYAEHHSTPYLTRDFFARMQAGDARALGDVRGLARRPPRRLLADRGRPRHRRRVRPLLGRARVDSRTSTSRPATTSRCSGASSTGSAASRAARRASTRWRAA